MAPADQACYVMIMSSYTLAQVRLAQLREFAEIDNRGVVPSVWASLEQGDLTEEEEQFLAFLRKRLFYYKTQMANEATIWARAIYPLLLLAERDDLRAYSQVPLAAKLFHGELHGEVDGVLAREGIDQDVTPPYVLVVEAKRGVEGHDPVAQLLGGLLCAAWENQQVHKRDEHHLYGAYTVADVWTFVDVKISSIDGEAPRMVMAFSREYMEKTEAGVILRLLKSMLSKLAGEYGVRRGEVASH